MEELESEGWRLKKGAYNSLLAVSKEEGMSLRDAALNADLRKIGDAGLPEGIGRTAGPLKGPHVLQVVSCIDVGHPSKGGVAGLSARRLLCWKLTDGRTSCKALEFKPVAGAEGDATAPGAKVLLAGATVKAGIFAVDAKSLKVLGGRVDELYEAWDFQRKFGGSARPAAASRTDNGQDADRPPQFKTFVPGKTRVPKRAPPADAAPNGHRHQILLDTCSAAADESVSRQDRQGIAAPPGFEGHPQPEGPAHEQLRTESPPTAQHASSAGSTAASGHASTAGQQAARAGMPAPPEEAAARQLHGSRAAKAKLQQRLAASEEGDRGRRRGRGGGRGRRGRYRDDEEETGMTLEEWEAQQQGALAPAGTTSSAMSDEALARQLQRQLDMEDAALAAAQHGSAQQPRSAEEDLRASLFAFDQLAQEDRGGGRGGFRRGRRGRGRRI